MLPLRPTLKWNEMTIYLNIVETIPTRKSASKLPKSQTKICDVARGVLLVFNLQAFVIDFIYQKCDEN